MISKIPEPDLEYLQKVLLEMLAIPSPTGFTDTIVRYVAERLEELGIAFEMTRRGTIRATLKGRKSSPDRAVSAHLDTIGASVRAIKDNGRLTLAPVGCWSSRFAEGSRVSLFTDTGVIRGSVLPLMASGHAFNTAVDELPISWDHIELRLDAYCTTRADCETLGVGIGDYVAFDPLPEFTESGHISARHLDDKAGVAALLAALKAIVDSGEELLIDCHPLFTITEETGSGAAAALPWDVSEFVGIDIAPVAPWPAFQRTHSQRGDAGFRRPLRLSSVAALAETGQGERGTGTPRPVPLLLQRRSFGHHRRPRYPHRPAGLRLRRHPWLRTHPHRQPGRPQSPARRLHPQPAGVRQRRATSPGFTGPFQSSDRTRYTDGK